MGTRAQQVEMLALPMHINQVASDFAQQLQVYDATIDATDIAAIATHLATQRHPVGVMGLIEPIRFQDRAQFGKDLAFDHLKGGIDLRQLTTGAHPICCRAIAQKHAQRINNN